MEKFEDTYPLSRLRVFTYPHFGSNAYLANPPLRNKNGKPEVLGVVQYGKI
jgi:hypothetical protein